MFHFAIGREKLTLRIGAKASEVGLPAPPSTKVVANDPLMYRLMISMNPLLLYLADFVVCSQYWLFSSGLWAIPESGRDYSSADRTS